jgi:hypothetical protein
VSTINKHVFLCGYLEGEPKSLVHGIAVTEETYEQTKKILQAEMKIFENGLHHCVPHQIPVITMCHMTPFPLKMIDLNPICPNI